MLHQKEEKEGVSLLVKLKFLDFFTWANWFSKKLDFIKNFELWDMYRIKETDLDKLKNYITKSKNNFE